MLTTVLFGRLWGKRAKLLLFDKTNINLLDILKYI